MKEKMKVPERLNPQKHFFVVENKYGVKNVNTLYIHDIIEMLNSLRDVVKYLAEKEVKG